MFTFYHKSALNIDSYSMYKYIKLMVSSQIIAYEIIQYSRLTYLVNCKLPNIHSNPL